jgi:argininosuccinate lyase
MSAALADGFLTATDLADHLASRGVSFRTAHEQAGQAVRAAEAAGLRLWELPPATLAELCPAADPAIAARLVPEASARSRTGESGPAPAQVAAQLDRARAGQGELLAWLAARRPPPIEAARRAGRLLAVDLP